MSEVASEFIQLILSLVLVMCDVERCLLPWWIVQEDARGTYQADGLFEQCKSLVHLRCCPRKIRGRIVLNHNALTLVGEGMPDLLGEIRQKWVEEAHGGFERLDKGLSGPCPFLAGRVLKGGLDQFE